ncbi:N-acetyltransferase [Streptomyces hoynatensis]|uniref:N-acetyltransferase n=1 Tax=Streptomyces hoynatensis TaxID=1141874 RepID=A0A3A9YTR0_9ACTN|nr:N-acetyltransferase [Streptomyces hoynatensis]RKN39453.1 N-acetyltransferase [Streptomyces hoynatensis]
MGQDARIRITTLAERPALAGRLYEIADTWPAFFDHEVVAHVLLGRVAAEFPAYCVVATEGERVVARGFAVPFDARSPGREETPDQGWDRVLGWAFHDASRGREATAASALEITVDAGYLGRGLSYLMLDALRQAAGRQGHGELLAPVRPTAKHLRPRLPMADYLRLLRPDGLPEDPWLRVHVRSGGRVEGIAPASMTVSGSLAQWREWTGLPFDRDGEVEVPGALVPVRCEAAHGYAVYVEPNVWVRHATRPRSA